MHDCHRNEGVSLWGTPHSIDKASPCLSPEMEAFNVINEGIVKTRLFITGEGAEM